MTTFVSKKSNFFGGRTSVPGDKSISIRGLIMAAIADGVSNIKGLPSSEDVVTTSQVLRALGVKIEEKGSLTRIEGVGGAGFKSPDEVLDFGNSGTASRLMMGVLASQRITAEISGDASLQKRPYGRVIDPLSQMGAVFSAGTLPIELTGSENLKPLLYDLPVASAQVKSAVLLAGLNTAGETGVIERTTTRDHTENLLGAFGMNIKKTKTGARNLITVLGPATLTGTTINIPGDMSATAFLLVAAMIAGKEDLVIEKVGVNQTRAALLDILKKMGAEISLENKKNDSGEEIADICLKPGKISGIITTPDQAAGLIDEFPILFIAASFANGPSEFQGLAELRHKESDRLKLMADGLGANGVRATIRGDDLIIEPGPVRGGGTIDACHDHRIAMAFLVLGVAAEDPVAVTGAETIATSFPGFDEVMNALGAKIEEVE